MMPTTQQFDPELDQEPSGGYRPLVVVLLSPLAFALVFASWTIFAVLGVELKALLGFSEARFAVLLAMPMTMGALAALPMALLAQRLGGRRVMIACLLLICPFLWGLSHSRDYHHFLLAGAGLGLGAGLLSAGLVYVAGLCPRRHAGLALGLFAALLPPVFVLGGEWLGVQTAGFMFLYAALVACMLVMLADHARGACQTWR